jgi:hypothetical protein
VSRVARGTAATAAAAAAAAANDLQKELESVVWLANGYVEACGAQETERVFRVGAQTKRPLSCIECVLKRKKEKENDRDGIKCEQKEERFIQSCIEDESTRLLWSP